MIYDDIINRLRRYVVQRYAAGLGMKIFSEEYGLIEYWLRVIAFDDWVDDDSIC
jgi:hypothetical protein